MTNNNNGANLGFEQKMWQAADKLRGNMGAAEYKHVALGFIFLKYISDAFEEQQKELAEKMFDEGLYMGFIGAFTYPAAMSEDREDLEEGK